MIIKWKTKFFKSISLKFSIPNKMTMQRSFYFWPYFSCSSFFFFVCLLGLVGVCPIRSRRFKWSVCIVFYTRIHTRIFFSILWFYHIQSMDWSKWNVWKFKQTSNFFTEPFEYLKEYSRFICALYMKKISRQIFT